VDSRLQKIDGFRLVHLRYSDVPRVAQAIVDAVNGRAKVLSGLSHDVPYLKFVKDKTYTVVIRGDDWQKIFPFLRYSSASYKPVIPPETQPPPIVSPQPDRVMYPPPVNPAGGLQSFLEGFPFDEYRKIQQLLTTLSIDNIDRQALPSKALNPISDPSSLTPPEQSSDLSFNDKQLYNQLVLVLQKLFPTDFPTKY